MIFLTSQKKKNHQPALQPKSRIIYSHEFVLEHIHEPIIALAPMEDVTDTAMRELILRVADPSARYM